MAYPVSRRDFVFMASAGMVCPAVLGADGRPRLKEAVGSAEIGKELTPWKYGELDLHFVHTGRGENMFYRFPDGTTMVNDTGDFYRPKEIKNIPWHPNGKLLGGEVMARYLARQVSSRSIDYAVVSHWHTDHVGAPSLGFRTAKDGRKICGLALLGEEFTFKNYFDHQYPDFDKYGSADESLAMMREFLEAKTKEGLHCEKFRPGALNQFRLLHDAEGKYRDSFSVRNVCANGVCWTGKGDETIDYAAIHTKAEGKDVIPNQNLLSMGFIIQYGKFRFWTGGDVSGFLKDANGKLYNYEAVVGKSVGEVTVCKTNHHAWKDAMVKEFVEEVKSAAYITNVWCPHHIQDCNMQHISSRTLYSGKRLVFPTFIPALPKQKWPNASWWNDIVPGGGHIAVRVAPGGETYKIYQLESSDETGKVKAVFTGVS
jgi:hypothetical protein